MKKILYLVIKSGKEAYDTLQELNQQGYNATVVSTESLRRAVEYYPEDHHFYNLRHFEKSEIQESILCLFVLEENKLEDLKNIIRKFTNNFKDIKGFMFSKNLNDYEGSI